MVDNFQSSPRKLDTSRQIESSKQFDSSRQIDSDREGDLTLKLEEQTSKLPSSSWLGLALGSMVVSAGIAIFSKKKEFANFVGLWAPSFLLIGIYNKIVKIEKSAEQKSNRSAA